jgi:hypothetical protein
MGARKKTEEIRREEIRMNVHTRYGQDFYGKEFQVLLWMRLLCASFYSIDHI